MLSEVEKEPLFELLDCIVPCDALSPEARELLWSLLESLEDEEDDE